MSVCSLIGKIEDLKFTKTAQAIIACSCWTQVRYQVNLLQFCASPVKIPQQDLPLSSAGNNVQLFCFIFLFHSARIHTPHIHAEKSVKTFKTQN